jgi:hypothetical protein
MRSFRNDSRARGLAFLLLSALVVGCGGDDGDDDGSPAGPSPAPGSATLVIDNLAATSTPGAGGTFNYRASLRLRETGGASATLTGLTLTMTQASGVSVSRDVAPADAFPTTTVAANATLDSNTLSVTGAPIQATQLAVRITYAGTAGATSTVQATTTVTAGG